MIRYLLPALMLVAGTACSETNDTPDGSSEAVGETGETSGASAGDAEGSETPATPDTPVREVVSGDVSSVSLDVDPAIADMVEDDGRAMALEIRTASLEAVLDSWGGVGTPMRLDCERAEPFTLEDGSTYEYYKDCTLP